jgi:hypothetical protein
LETAKNTGKAFFDAQAPAYDDNVFTPNAIPEKNVSTP